MPSKLKLILLGEVFILKGEKRIENLPSRAAEALFLYLVCNKRTFFRESMAELLWAERSQSQGLTNLRTILTALKRELGEYLVITRDSLAFDAESDYWLDAEEFERSLKEMGLPDRGEVPKNESEAQELQSVLDLYRGDFLAGFHLRDGQGFEEWAILQRERLKRLARDGFRLLTAYHLENGNYTEGVASADRWERLDPYDEEACRAQMWLLVRTGQRNAAVQCYQVLKDKLQKDLGVAPSSATTDLFQRIRQLDFPPLQSLPSYSTRFLGRGRELEQLGDLLISKDTRLITIVGPGGMGKTRLAAEAARALIGRKPGRFLNGVAFIPLAAVTTPEEIPVRIAEVLGFTFQGEDTVQKQLVDYLRGRELLLILDNLEHLFDGAGAAIALLVDILRSAAETKVMVTSRERLNLYDEVVFDVSGLDVPDSDGSLLADSSAATLFIEGARRIRKEFSPTTEEWEAIARICRAVNGMPLAIELASAWVRDYLPEQIAAQIPTKPDFLTSSYMDVNEGHRSLRAVFERSWSLLSQDEQTVYAQLSMFRGGFTLESASSVVQAEGAIDITLSIATLADKSLLERLPDDRFDLHPLLAQFAAEKLSASDLDLGVLSANHAAYYLKFLADLGGGESPEQRALIRPEQNNIRQAVEYAASSGMLTELEETAGILQSFFSMQSWFQEGIDLFQRVIDILVESGSPGVEGLLCDLLSRKARMLTQIGQLKKARADSQQALSYLERMDDPARRSRAFDSLAITSYYSGNYQQATDLAEQSLRLSEEMNNLEGIAFSLNFLGSCAKAQGRYDQCRVYFERAVDACRAINDEVGAAMVLNNLGNLLQIEQNFDGAQQYYLQSSEVFKAQDHVHGAATTLANAGKLALKQGDYQRASDLLEESLSLKRKINDKRGEAVALAGLADIALVSNEFDEARERLIPALQLAQQSGDVRLLLDILTAVAMMKTGQADDDFHASLAAYIRAHAGTADEARQRLTGLDVPSSDEGVFESMSVEDAADIVIKKLQDNKF